MKLVNKLQALQQKLSNEFLHNPVCWSCGLSHEGKKRVCATCESNIRYIAAPCTQCGLSHKGKGNVCAPCLSKPKLWHNMVAPLSYKNPISHSIQQLKYNQKLEVLTALIELVEPVFRHVNPKPDLLIPVPLHQNRYLERGFNQSYEIAILLSKALDIPCSDDYVERIVDTQRQSELKFKQRGDNIKNAFVVNKRLSEFKHVVIIDDVVTTGSTVHEVSKQCLKKGVERVDIWAIARTELD